MDSRHVAGQNAEAAALDYLVAQGLSCVARNYRCRSGELDLVMLDGETLVVAEVRFRKASAFASAAQSVGSQKQRRLVSATQHFLMRHPKLQEHPVRFDVIALDEDVTGATNRIQWIKDAFEA
ncbi:MAG: YraN family protein [Pseudomonadota bacterium]